MEDSKEEKNEGTVEGNEGTGKVETRNY